MKTAIVTGTVLIVLILAAIVLLPREKANNTVSGKETVASTESESPSAENSPAKSSQGASDSGAREPGDPGLKERATKITDQSRDDALEQALQSMRESLNREDARTPEMSEPYQREMPTAEELADPALYEAYELRQSKKLASVYAGVSKEIPAIRQRIENARLNGTQSPEDIREAEEALAKMESLSEMLRLSHPELEQNSSELLDRLEVSAPEDTDGEGK